MTYQLITTVLNDAKTVYNRFHSNHYNLSIIPPEEV